MKKRPPRKQAPIPRRLGTAPSMKAASSDAWLGLRYETMKAAKNLGCKAFKQNGNVDCDVLKHWLETERPDILEMYENIPNIGVEEAWKTQAERKEKELKVLRVMGVLVPKDQPRRALIAVAKIFLGKLYALPDRLHIKYGVPKDEIREECDHIAAALRPEEYEKLMTDLRLTR